LFMLAEFGSYAVLTIYYRFLAKPHDVSQPRKDTLLYLKRFHPLFVDNSDIRKRNPDLDFDPFVGYKFAPNVTHSRPHHSYMSNLEIDDMGFPHNGDPVRNSLMFNKPSSAIYRVV